MKTILHLKKVAMVGAAALIFGATPALADSPPTRSATAMPSHDGFAHAGFFRFAGFDGWRGRGWGWGHGGWGDGHGHQGDNHGHQGDNHGHHGDHGHGHGHGGGDGGNPCSPG